MEPINESQTAEVLHLGCQGFNFGEWRGLFYPSRLKPGQFLSYYASVFSYLELDTSYFVIPRAETVRAWHRQTPAHFRFSLQLPAKISGELGFRDCSGELMQFLEAITLLEEKLAPIVIQTPPEMDLGWQADLSAFLDGLPGDFRCAFDFSHPSWYCSRVYDMLRSFGHCLCLSDRPEVPRELQLCADFLVVRLCGDNTRPPAHALQQDRREDFVYIRNQLQALRKSHSLYLSCGNAWNGFAPGALSRLLAELQLPEPSFGESQQDLFPFLALEGR